MTATIAGTLALLDGAMKYGRSNYREIGVRSSIYYDAAVRHLTAWFEGEEADPDSGIDHLGHALACIAILVDAKEAGKLNDDRNIQGGYRAMIDRLTSEVNRIKARHADKSPKHYDINDNRCVFHATEGEYITNNRCVLPRHTDGDHVWERDVIERTQYVDNIPPGTPIPVLDPSEFRYGHTISGMPCSTEFNTGGAR